MNASDRSRVVSLVMLLGMIGGAFAGYAAAHSVLNALYAPDTSEGESCGNAVLGMLVCYPVILVHLVLLGIFVGGAVGLLLGASWELLSKRRGEMRL